MTSKLDPDSEPDKQPNSPDEVDNSSKSDVKFSAFASLRIPNFRWLFGGSLLSSANMWIQQVTLGWLIYDITGSGTMLGSINLIRAMASVLMIPFAGLMVDRFNRRKLISIENIVLFIFTSIMGVLLLTGQKNVSYLFIFTFFCGMAQSIDHTARQVIMFDIVPKSVAPNAVAVLQTGWSIMRVVGPSIGGFLIASVGAGGNFLIQSGIFALVAITILQTRFPAQKTLTAVQQSPLQNIKEGMKFVVKEKATRTFLLLGIVLPLLTIPIFSTLPPIYAVKVFGDESGRVLGFLMASAGVGGVLGGVVVASLGRFEYRGRLQLVSLLLVNLALIAFAFSSSLPLALFWMAVAGFFEMVFLATNQTLVQLSIPDHLRGRVTAVIQLSMAVQPLGSMIAGAGSDLLGGPKMITIILAAVSAVIALFVFLFSPTVRNYRLSEGMASHSQEKTKD